MRGEDESAGVSHAINVQRAEFPDCSLNALMLTPSRLYAIHINSNAASPTLALNEIFASSHLDAPAGHETEYFAMSYRVTPNAGYVISSGLEEEGWSAMSADSVVAIDLTTRVATPWLPMRTW